MGSHIVNIQSCTIAKSELEKSLRKTTQRLRSCMVDDRKIEMIHQPASSISWSREKPVESEE